MENRPIPNTDFTNLMSKGELIAAAIYLPIHALGLPLGLGWLAERMPALAALDSTGLNLVYYGLGMAYVLILLRRFLRRSFDAALDAKGRFLLGIIGGYAMDIGLSFVISALLLVFGLELGMSPNNQAVMAEVTADHRRMAVMVVVMLLGLSSMIFGTVKNPAAFLIPAYNCVQMMSQIFSASLSPVCLAVTLVSNAVYIGLLVFVLTKMFQSEKCMFNA